MPRGSTPPYEHGGDTVTLLVPYRSDQLVTQLAMRRTNTRRLALIAFASLLFACSRRHADAGFALPSLPSVSPAHGTAAIRGRVLHGRAPVNNADVALCREFAHTEGVCSGPHPTTRTDANGAYVFNSVAPGDFGAVLITLDGAHATAWDPVELRTVRAGEVFDAPTTFLATPTVVLISPADGAQLTDRRPTFQWRAVPDAAYYRFSVQARRFDVLRPFIATRIRVNGTSFTAPEAISSGTYLWRVEAFDTDDHALATSTPGVTFVVPSTADAGTH